MDYKSPLRIAMEKAMNGEHAFTRENPKPWETKHYFMKWPDDPFSTASDAQIIDVPDDVDPEEFRLNGYQVPSAQALVEEPQLTGSLFDTPVGYQSLLDDSSNNFLEESTSYPTSSYNSMVLETPQSFGLSSVRTPANTSLTGGLSQNTFGSSANNFSYPNALGTGGGTLTERMAATLKARETPYESLSDDATSSMSELSGNSFNSSQCEPSSSTDESWFNSLFGSKPAFGATLSSQGINNEATGVSLPTDEELSKALSRHIPALKA
ncbi:MAG: hypothetical protein J6V53_01010, partial [Alphaproteobacteria bacterium]|nr:hypothetical protein [Alphaproteobacteria bacterium]